MRISYGNVKRSRRCVKVTTKDFATPERSRITYSPTTRFRRSRGYIPESLPVGEIAKAFVLDSDYYSSNARSVFDFKMKSIRDFRRLRRAREDAFYLRYRIISYVWRVRVFPGEDYQAVNFRR